MAKPDTNMVIGENVRDIRKSLNLTQEQFSEKVDINPQFLSQVETGKSGISIDNAINICNTAGCSSVHLFKGLINSKEVINNYELLSERDKTIINQMIEFLINTK